MLNNGGKSDLSQLSTNLTKNVLYLVRQNREFLKDLNLIYDIINKNNFIKFKFSTNKFTIDSIGKSFKDIKNFIEILIKEINKTNEENINNKNNNNKNTIINDNINNKEYINKQQYDELMKKYKELNQNNIDLINKNNKLKDDYDILIKKIEGENNFKLLDDENNINDDNSSNNYIFGLFNVGIIGLQNKEENKKENEDEKNDRKSNNNISNSISYKRTIYKNFYFFGDILEEKMKTIEEIKKIIGKEKYDITFKNMIDEYKYKNIVQKIPEEYHPNIVLGINHYNKVLIEYEVWDKKNKERNLNEKNVVYPSKEIRIIKDDTIQYNN
jgi:hypothetical protein